MHELQGGPGACPREIVEFGLSITPFPAFPGREVVINREGLLRHHNTHKKLNDYFITKKKKKQ